MVCSSLPPGASTAAAELSSGSAVLPVLQVWPGTERRRRYASRACSQKPCRASSCDLCALPIFQFPRARLACGEICAIDREDRKGRELVPPVRKRRQIEPLRSSRLICFGRSRVINRPGDQRNLQRQPRPLHPGFSHQSRERDVRDSHVNVGWKHGDQQKRQSISRRPPEPSQKQASASQNLSRTADAHKRQRPRAASEA